MFYEEFVTECEKEDNPAGEYISDELKIKYYLENISDGIPDVIRLINHEWLHGLFDWATECDTESGKLDESKDHWIMKKMHFD